MSNLFKLREVNPKQVEIFRRTAVGLVGKLNCQVSIVEAFLFGSAVAGLITPDSDLDILVVFNSEEEIREAKTVVYTLNFSPVAVDWVFKTKSDFCKRKEIGGVCWEAFNYGWRIQLD